MFLKPVFVDRIVKQLLARCGYSVRRSSRAPTYPVEFSPSDRSSLDLVKARGLSMASDERLFATLMACNHVVREGVRGDFVECGVWRGGNSILAANVFSRLSPDRCVHLFDTFAGMTAPTRYDVDSTGESAQSLYDRSKRPDHNEWCYASIEDVKRNFGEAGLDESNIRFIQGDVIQTLANQANLPKHIAVLRLDTDWYESTLAELEVLYPLLSVGGVLIVDDYGHWAGAKRAVDEYFSGRPRPFLQYTDYTGRIGVKVVASPT